MVEATQVRRQGVRQIVDDRSYPVRRIIQGGITLGQCRQRRLQLYTGDVAARHARGEAETHGAHARTEIEDALAGLYVGGGGQQHRVHRDPISASGLQELHPSAHYSVFGRRGFRATHLSRF